MHKYTTFFIGSLLVFLMISLHAQGQTAPTWLWARPTNGPAAAQALAVATDASGNVYQYGSFGRTAQIGSTVLTSSGTSFNLFLAKYNTAGTVQWAIQSNSVSAGSFVGGTAVTTDAIGNVYIVGAFSGTIMLESTTLIGNGAYNGFVAKFNTLGALQWTISSSGSSATSQTFVNSIATDANGDLYLAGRFSDAVTFGSISAISQGSSDAYLLKMNAAGTPQWLQSGGSTGADFGSSVAIGSAGRVYVSGTLAGNASFGSISATSLGGTDAFLAAYDAQGNPQWVRNFGGSTDDAGGGVAVGASGEIYQVGRFQGVGGFNAIYLSSRGLYDGYLVKCNAQGMPLWANQMGGSGNDQALGLGLKDGVPYVTGQFSVTANFSTQSRVSMGGTDIFAARYSTAGSLVWVEASGSIGTDTDAGIAFGPNGAVYIGGQFSNTVQVGPFSLVNQGAINSYLAALRDNVPTPTVATRLAGEFSLYPNPVGPKGLTLTLPDKPAESAVIEVLDLAGRIVQSQRVVNAAGRAVTVPTASLVAGQYLLRYQAEQTTVHKRFVVL